MAYQGAGLHAIKSLGACCDRRPGSSGPHDSGAIRASRAFSLAPEFLDKLIDLLVGEIGVDDAFVGDLRIDPRSQDQFSVYQQGHWLSQPFLGGQLLHLLGALFGEGDLDDRLSRGAFPLADFSDILIGQVRRLVQIDLEVASGFLRFGKPFGRIVFRERTLF